MIWQHVEDAELPWPSGHGPIEAYVVYFGGISTIQYFRGLRVTAPLKQLKYVNPYAIVVGLPWPSGHGPIEANPNILKYVTT